MQRRLRVTEATFLQKGREEKYGLGLFDSGHIFLFLKSEKRKEIRK